MTALVEDVHPPLNHFSCFSPEALAGHRRNLTPEILENKSNESSYDGSQLLFWGEQAGMSIHSNGVPALFFIRSTPPLGASRFRVLLRGAWSTYRHGP